MADSTAPLHVACSGYVAASVPFAVNASTATGQLHIGSNSSYGAFDAASVTAHQEGGDTVVEGTGYFSSWDSSGFHWYPGGCRGLLRLTLGSMPQAAAWTITAPDGTTVLQQQNGSFLFGGGQVLP